MKFYSIITSGCECAVGEKLYNEKKYKEAALHFIECILHYENADDIMVLSKDTKYFEIEKGDKIIYMSPEECWGLSLDRLYEIQEMFPDDPDIAFDYQAMYGE